MIISYFDFKSILPFYDIFIDIRTDSSHEDASDPNHNVKGYS